MPAQAESSIQARWVFPVEGVPVRDGVVSIRGGRIASIEPAGGRVADVDLGNVAITPGFVNAHTHLELPRLGEGVAGAPTDQIEWLGRVVAYRRGARDADLKSTAARHVGALLASGTTCVADVTTRGLSYSALVDSPLRGIVYSELIGLTRARAMETSREAFEWLRLAQRSRAGAKRIRAGLSPHSPYSTAGWLYERCAGAGAGVPLSTHLAELPEELELLAHREGRLRTFLESLDVWADDWAPLGARPADYIRRGELRNADWLVAHGTYLDEEDFWQLRPEAALKGQRVAVAYCPRSTDYFGHGPHPFRRMLERGIVVCVGTDSVASAPSLSVLDEIRYLRARDPTVSGELLLAMATLFGAWAMRLDHEVGSLKPGKAADLAIVALPDAESEDPHRLLLESDLPVRAAMIQGEVVKRSA